MNHSQRNLKKLIRAKEDSIADEELFLSAAYQKYQTSLARAVTGRYRYGLQVLLDWDISEQAGVAYTDNYKVHLNAANPITQSFPTRFLRSQSLTGLTGHEVGHLLYSDFTAHAVHLRSLENGSFYPKEPELSLPAYQTALEEIKEVLEEKDKAGCLTLARCAGIFQNILEDIHIEDRMCEEFHGTFRQGIELNNLRMSEQIPSIQEQIDKDYQPFSIIANLLLSYCRTGNINNPTGYQGEYLDSISDCTDLLDAAMESEKGTDRMLASNALLALTWNYIQPLIEKTREELEMHGEDSAADALEDLHQDDEEDHGEEHDQILVAVVAVVDGDLAEAAAADDTAHGRVAQNGGDGDGTVGNEGRNAFRDQDLRDDLEGGGTHALGGFYDVGVDLPEGAFHQTGDEGEGRNDQRDDGGGGADYRAHDQPGQREDHDHQDQERHRPQKVNDNIKDT